MRFVGIRDKGGSRYGLEENNKGKIHGHQVNITPQGSKIYSVLEISNTFSL